MPRNDLERRSCGESLLEIRPECLRELTMGEFNADFCIDSPRHLNLQDLGSRSDVTWVLRWKRGDTTD